MVYQIHYHMLCSIKEKKTALGYQNSESCFLKIICNLFGYFSLFSIALGVTLNCLVKQRVKYFGSLNPTS